jgi:hypothetical protein
LFYDKELDRSGTLRVDDERLGGVSLAREALLNHLRREWPDSVDVAALQIAPGLSGTDFLKACSALLDDGLIMYEALLTGVGPSPRLLAAVLTVKGHKATSQEPY